jgi:hypothetical protein
VTRAEKWAARLLAARHPPNAAFLWAERLVQRRSPVVAQLPIDLVREFVRRGGLHRALVFGDAPEGATTSDVLKLVDKREFIGPAAVLIGNLHLPPGQLSSALHEAIALDMAGEPLQREAAFQAVERNPARMLAGHRMGIFDKAWSLSRQPIDPYAPIDLHHAARRAAAALLTAHAEIRARAIDRLASDGPDPQLELVYATAVQGMSGAVGSAVASLLAAINPDSGGALAFARDSDRDFSAIDSIEVEHGSFGDLRTAETVARSWRIFRGWLPVLVALIGVPCVFVGLAFASGMAISLPHRVHLSVSAILPVAAVLVAIHVVAAELAADRLPGLVARATSVPLPLWAGYGSVGGLILLAALAPNRTTTNSSVVAIGLVAAVVVSLIAALQQLLSRTDNAVAARIFAAGELGRAARSGRAVGRLHRTVFAQRSALSALAWVRPSMSAPLSVRRLDVPAPGSGYLVCRPRRLARVNKNGWWTKGGRLWLYGVLGTQVEPGDGIASVVLPSAGVADKPTIDALGRLFAVRSLRSLERIAEGVTALISLTAQIAESGNEAAANHVATETVRLYATHLESLISQRGPLPRGDAGAPVVVARAAALAMTRALVRVDHPAAEEVLKTLAQRFLRRCKPGDTFISILMLQLAEFPARGGKPDIAEFVMEDCGRRVVELNDRLLSQIWWQAAATLEFNHDRRDSLVALESRFVQHSVLANGWAGERAWRHLVTRLDQTKSRDQVAAIRVGASALLVGNITLATTVALWLRSFADWTTLRTWFDRPDVHDRESAYDSVHGNLLGTDVSAALAEFVSLAEAIEAHVR